MPTQLALLFDNVPVTCPVQERYHAIAPCLSGDRSPRQQAQVLGISYATVTNWLRQFRTEGMPGLFPKTEFAREPYAPERVIVLLLYFKFCLPRVSDRELARGVGTATGQRLHNETVKAPLARYFFWRHPEFRNVIRYPVPADALARRAEMVKLSAQGWSERTISMLSRCSRVTVHKWVRRWREEQARGDTRNLWLLDGSHIPHQPRRKVFMGAIHATLQLQQRYGYAGWFRIQGLLRKDFRIELSEATSSACYFTVTD